MINSINSKTLHSGPIFDVRRDTIREGEAMYERDVVVHRGSAVIAAVFDDSRIALVRQYRHAAGEYLLELPAGSLEIGEDPEIGALRELEEEIGYRAAKIEKIAEFYVSPGFLTEKMHVYLATELTKTEQNLDDDEFIDVQLVRLAEAKQMVVDGRICDAKTMIGIMNACARSGI